MMFYIMFFIFISLICSTINIFYLIYSLVGAIEVALGIISLIIFIIGLFLFSFFNGIKKKFNYIIVSSAYWLILILGTLFSHLFSNVIFNIFSVTTITPIMVLLPSDNVPLDIIIFVIVLIISIGSGYYLGTLVDPNFFNKKELKSINKSDTNIDYNTTSNSINILDKNENDNNINILSNNLVNIDKTDNEVKNIDKDISRDTTDNTITDKVNNDINIDNIIDIMENSSDIEDTTIDSTIVTVPISIKDATVEIADNDILDDTTSNNLDDIIIEDTIKENVKDFFEGNIDKDNK